VCSGENEAKATELVRREGVDEEDEEGREGVDVEDGKIG